MRSEKGVLHYLKPRPHQEGHGQPVSDADILGQVMPGSANAVAPTNERPVFRCELALEPHWFDLLLIEGHFRPCCFHRQHCFRESWH